jgi:hypothetical protein
MKKPKPPTFALDFTAFNESMRKFGYTMAEWSQRIREGRLNRQGISTGYAPSPYHGTDI